MLASGVESSQKSSRGDLVTAADRAAEQMVVDLLSRARPADGVVGEEDAARQGTSGRTWFVDPVDGTYNFVHGLPWWCSALALQEADEVLLGAVHHTEGDDTWVGGRDLPTTRNGVQLPRLGDRDLEDCSVATYLHLDYFSDADVQEPFAAVASGAKAVRSGGSGSMDLAAVADGRLDLWCQRDAERWDWMPGFALVEGVGGTTAHLTVRGHTWSLAGPATAVGRAIRLLQQA
ncbi:inositol monophosphatase [Nocardioides sp. Y6]|uniref:Inositol monophosphatase n=2 Tax=Nocardioides malaquae TaxID=2773426 RepID=A0ABR9RPC9_9ACTN|nr:inositol monophosphatase [Nocardioides malaquae]